MVFLMVSIQMIENFYNKIIILTHNSVAAASTKSKTSAILYGPKAFV
jgi:hypothetical protein